MLISVAETGSWSLIKSLHLVSYALVFGMSSTLQMQGMKCRSLHVGSEEGLAQDPEQDEDPQCWQQGGPATLRGQGFMRKWARGRTTC